jgi:hypothetical protein
MPELALRWTKLPEYEDLVAVPSTLKDRQLVRKMRIVEGEVSHLDVKLRRVPAHHRLVFLLLEFVFENQDQYRDIDRLREALTLATSFTYTVQTLGGHWQRMPRSWSYATMDEAEFSKLHSELVDVVLQWAYPSEGKRWLKEAVDFAAFQNNVLGMV